MQNMKSQTEFDYLGLVQSLHLPQEFGVEVDTSKMLSEQKWHLEDAIRAFTKEPFELRYGITKVVIVFEHLPKVVKIPFSGFWYPNYDAEDDETEYFVEFENACDDDAEDYCMDEWIKYEDMCKNGFGRLAAAVDFLYRDLNGRAYYTQEKVDMWPHYPSDSKTRENTLDHIKHMAYQYKCAPTSWMASVIEEYGERFWENFVNWAAESSADDESTSICADLHNDNVGFINGMPVILDLSGFRED